MIEHPSRKCQGSVSSRSSSSWHCAWPSSAGRVEAGHCWRQVHAWEAPGLGENLILNRSLFSPERSQHKCLYVFWGK